MAIVSMADASAGAIALSAEYNKVTANIRDLDARLGPVVSASSAATRLGNLETRATSLESLTTNTSGNVGIGNQRLSDRLGSDVTTANTAAAQLAALQAVTGTSQDVCYAYQNTAQVIAQGTPISMDAELIDTNTMHDLATNNTRLTAKKAGLFLIGGGVGLVGGGLQKSRRVAYIRLNGTTTIPGTAVNVYPSQDTTWNLMVPTPVIPVQLAVNDYIELMGYWGAEDTVITTTSGPGGTSGRLTVVTAGYNSFMYAIYLRP